MNLIYLHGFRSSPQSLKGQQLKQFAENDPEVSVHLPDLNLPPLQVMQKLDQLVESLSDVALVGSSLGGFYATQLVAKHHLPAVLINPAMRPWQLFRELFADEALPYTVAAGWTLDHQQLIELEQIAVAQLEVADKILVLLQQGDEVLDYHEAQRYYTQSSPVSLIFTDAHGNHAMEDFEKKLPFILAFLSYSLK